MHIGRLMETLGLGELEGEPLEIKGGLLHRMYCVTTREGKYAVKALNGEIMKRPMALRNTINSEKVAAAFSGHIPVVASLRIQGRQIHELDGSYYMVFPWTEGRSVFPPDISERHCEAIGEILGKMHHMNISVAGLEPEQDDVVIYEWDKYLRMTKETEGAAGAWLSRYEEALKDIKAWNQAACDAQEALAEHMVISHRDLDPKNVMWADENPFVIDWEAAGYINPYQELLEVINYWADDGYGGLRQEYFERLVSAYRKHVNMSDVEWDVVFAGSYMGMLGWLEYNVKRALGIEVSADERAEEIRQGEEQVIGTIKALYDYRKKTALMKEALV